MSSKRPQIRLGRSLRSDQAQQELSLAGPLPSNQNCETITINSSDRKSIVDCGGPVFLDPPQSAIATEPAAVARNSWHFGNVQRVRHRRRPKSISLCLVLDGIHPHLQAINHLRSGQIGIRLRREPDFLSFIRQEHTRGDIEARQSYIAAQIKKIEQSCEIVPVVAPDTPSELASTLADAFGADVLDPAHIAAEGYVLLSEDIYFR